MGKLLWSHRSPSPTQCRDLSRRCVTTTWVCKRPIPLSLNASRLGFGTFECLSHRRGDAIHERGRVDRVVERLNGEFAATARLETIRWETEFYRAHTTFQAQIPEAADCDILI